MTFANGLLNPFRSAWRYLAPHWFTPPSLQGLYFIRSMLCKHWFWIAMAGAANLVSGLCEGSTMGILPLAIQLLINQEVSEWTATIGTWGQALFGRPLDHRELFLFLMGLAVGLQLTRTSLQLVGNVIAAHLRTVVEVESRRRTFQHVMRMDYARFCRYKIGNMLTYFQKACHVGQVVQTCNDLMTHALIGLALVAVLLYISWPMTLLTLAALPLLSWPIRSMMRVLRATGKERIDSLVSVNEVAVEYLQGLRLIRTHGREDFATARIEALLRRNQAAERRGLIWQTSLSPVFDAITILGVVGFLVISISLLGSTGTRRGLLLQMLAFLFILYRLLPRLQFLQSRWAGIAECWPAVCRIAQFLQQPPALQTSGRRQPPVPFRQIEFQGVSLQYLAEERKALADLSFTIPWGSTVALVGESGGGKSSVVDLLLRFYDPTAGRILVDGIDLQDYDLQAWRSCIGVVSQDTFVFNASIRDNIAFGKLDATFEDIVQAARRANAHDFIKQLADGYDTLIGDRGTRLSGGQRQRLAIARAILRNCKLLIFDEATSNLDSQSEQVILQSLRELARHCTMLVIAHRLSTIVAADQIIVLDKGRLIEQGRHEQLLARKGYYARLWQLQSGAASQTTHEPVRVEAA